MASPSGIHGTLRVLQGGKRPEGERVPAMTPLQASAVTRARARIGNVTLVLVTAFLAATIAFVAMLVGL
jgi:hypothetical protein